MRYSLYRERYSSLVSKLDYALDSIEAGKTNPASGQLGAFLDEVSAQSGKELTEAQADILIDTAQGIIDSI